MNASVGLIQEAAKDSSTRFGSKLKHAIFDGVSLSCSKLGCNNNVGRQATLKLILISSSVKTLP